MRLARFILLLLMACAYGAPQKGQIVVDPNHPGRMVYHETYENGKLKPCFFVGPGDPEDFFYNNTLANRGMLIAKGARCTYITAYLHDFGGGDPGTGSALDSTLTTWETHITALENAGIITVFFVFDDSKARPVTWQKDLDKIVAKFKHHKLLIWSVAEEYQEAHTVSQVAEIAARIKSQDDYNHIVGVHQLTGTDFHFNGYANLEMFLMQNNVTSAEAIHVGVLKARKNTGGKKIINMSEVFDHAKQNRITARKWCWAAAMGGASAVQVFMMGRSADSASWNEQGKYDDCARLMDFFEKTDLNSMLPKDDLASGSTRWVLANPGNSYIAYADSMDKAMGVMGMIAGNFTLHWLDIATGATVLETKVIVAGTNVFTTPAGFSGHETALWIARAK